MDIFDYKSIHPMLIKEQQQPFNSQDWIYELKLDGIRCIAYLDTNTTDLRNKRDFSLISKFPELVNTNKQVKEKVILDGELIVIKNGSPDFYELQRRTILTDRFKIQQAYTNLPASYVVYDIIYYKDKEIIDLPLMKRKEILSEVVIENPRIAVSRYIEECGIELYNLADQQKLEGVVAKKKESRYYYDKRSKDWVKFKRMHDREFLICGIIRKKPMSSFLLGAYNKNDKLVYCGSVSFGVKLDILRQYDFKRISYSPFTLKENNTIEGETGIVQWLEPNYVCTIEYMPNTKDSLRQPVFKGIREDIPPHYCKIEK